MQAEPTAWLAKERSHFTTDGERLLVDAPRTMESQKLLLAAASYSTEIEPDIVSQSTESGARERSQAIPMTQFSTASL